ncbi:MAG: hypothetical protein ABSB59_44420, partial [Streptosporangiaceae bacterium]
MLPFDMSFVRYWSDRYRAEGLSSLEDDIFGQVGPAAARRGYLTSDDLARIGRWKTQRAKSYLARNEPSLVEDVTRIAFAPQTPDRLRHRILALLAGVGHPMASAILTVWRPDEHTVLDYRVVAALQELGNRGVLNSDAPGGSGQALPGYWAYLQAYRPIANNIGANYRDLDRALWKWHKADMPDRWLGMRPDSAAAVPAQATAARDPHKQGWIFRRSALQHLAADGRTAPIGVPGPSTFSRSEGVDMKKSSAKRTNFIAAAAITSLAIIPLTACGGSTPAAAVPVATVAPAATSQCSAEASWYAATGRPELNAVSADLRQARIDAADNNVAATTADGTQLTTDTLGASA